MADRVFTTAMLVQKIRLGNLWWLQLLKRQILIFCRAYHSRREVEVSNPLAPTIIFKHLRLPAKVAVLVLWQDCGRRAILPLRPPLFSLKEKGLHFPTNFQSIGYIEFEPGDLTARTADLLKELIGWFGQGYSH